MDAGIYEANGKGGFGGVFQDQNGDWILDFYGKLICTSSLETEIYGIYEGLSILLEKKISNVQIESDSLTAVNLINEGNPANHPQSVTINEAHYDLMSRTSTTLGHIPLSHYQGSIA